MTFEFLVLQYVPIQDPLDSSPRNSASSEEESKSEDTTKTLAWTRGGKFVCHDSSLEECLNILGKKGWQLAVATSGGGRMIFQRIVPTAEVQEPVQSPFLSADEDEPEPDKEQYYGR